jgi:hypothetical protein
VYRRQVTSFTGEAGFLMLLHLSLKPLRPGWLGKPVAACWLRLLGVSVVGLALAWPAVSPAEDRTPGRKAIRAKFSSLRLKYPTLKSVRFGGLAGKLAAWLPVGQTIPVWVTDSRRQCDKDSLLRLPDLDGQPHFVVRECTPIARDDQGRWTRTCVDEPVGRDWWTSNGVSTEVRIGGVWRDWSGMAIGDPVQGNGILSDVTVDAARFRGRVARLSTACENRAMPCPGGGSYSCLVCAPLVVAVDACPGCTGGYGSSYNPETCDGPCPPRMDKLDQDWIEHVNSLDPWIPAEKDEPFAGIYRSLKACRADAARFTQLPTTHGEK